MATDAVLDRLLARLWQQYCERVEYARRYRDLVQARGGRVVNDHIAFRTFNTAMGALPSGIEALSRIFVPLGYKAAGNYVFEDKHLVARHFEHPAADMPKIFISQLEVSRLPEDCATLIQASVADARDLLDGEALEVLPSSDALPMPEADAVADRLYAFVTTRPWPPPREHVVREVNRVSQYAAWTLLHANSVNHFTAYINEQRVPEWPDIDATVGALRAEGIPMKEKVEGEPGSRLRQSATAAVEEDCEVLDEAGQPGTLRWSYAYYELAERGEVPGPDGRPVRFSGFLGPQATHLFEMTRR